METREIACKEIVLLTVPVLLITVVGLMLSKSKPLLALEKIKAVPLTSEGRRYRFSEPDTQVTLIAKATPSLYQRLVKRNWSSDQQSRITSSIFLVNEMGWKSTPHFQGLRNMKYLGHDRYSMELVIPLRDVPRSAGKVTLTAILTADNGCSLPVSVIVRDTV